MTEFVIKPYAMDVPEACLRTVALILNAPKYNCRIRKCRRNRRCSGEMIASDGRLEALAPAEHAAAPWLSGARVPPCFCNISEPLLAVLAQGLPKAHKTITRLPDSAAGIYLLWKITVPIYLDRFPRDWPKKPA